MNLLKDKVLLRNLLFQGDQLNTLSGGVAQITMKVDQQEDGFLINVHAPGVSANHLKVISDKQSMQIFATLAMENADNMPAIMPIFYRKLDLPLFVDMDAVEAIHKGNELEVFVPMGANNAGAKKEIEIKQI
jgi:HSP20 family protein